MRLERAFLCSRAFQERHFETTSKESTNFDSNIDNLRTENHQFPRGAMAIVAWGNCQRRVRSLPTSQAAFAYDAGPVSKYRTARRHFL